MSNVATILAAIDAELAKLNQARALLIGEPVKAPKGKSGRPVTKATPVKAAKVAPIKKKKRNLTPEGRARIAEAVKRRWAKQKEK
jgi:hypothetical protein